MTHTEQTISRWSRWRWPLVIPIFLAAWFATRWVPFLGIAHDNQEPYIAWIGYNLVGLLPTYLPAKLAPSRQLPLAIECAILTISYIVFALMFAVFEWGDGTYSRYAIALYSIYSLATLGGAATALWFVRRNRPADPERGSTWARATGVILPPVFVAAAIGDAFI